MALRLVPFNSTWVNHDKIDIHAIYRRPRFREDAFGERQREYKDGIATWDLTGPLPIRQHNRWLQKGFEYVTLANREALLVAAKFGTLPEGTTATTFDQHQTGGPWNWRKYSEGQDRMSTIEAEQLRADVFEFGSNAVEKLKKRTDPLFELPQELRDVPPGGLPEIGRRAGETAGEAMAAATVEIFNGTAARPKAKKKKRPAKATLASVVPQEPAPPEVGQ